ncbi:MAG TPA: DRTGG domain-containing protein [Bacillota bacterium]
MVTKHEQILHHISTLEVGTKISVRQIAKTMDVSEGTAYRAIKEAENQGLVSTIERVGTIRIEQKKKENFERLTYAEIVNVVDGQVLGGREGLHKTLSKFVIGAMKLDAMMRYTEPDSLLIVGNRVKAHELALNEGASVLITGGFDTEDHIKQLADKMQLPIISTSYDTFTVAAMINRAIYDQLIKKEIVLVEDIAIPSQDVHYLHPKDSIERWYELEERSKHTRFPVLSKNHDVIGMVTSRDILEKDPRLTIDKIMTRNPLVVHGKTSLAYAAHMMVWEGIDLVPVVNEANKFEGIISRQDVLKALQQIQRHPQVVNTIDDIVSSNMETIDGEETTYATEVLPQMTNQLGSLSNGVFTAIITEASSRLLQHLKKGDLVVENITVYFIEPVPIESQLIIKPRLLEAGRIYAKIDVEVFTKKKLVGKGLLMAQVMDR